jgi:tyrosine type site-specific recombinase
MTWQLNRFVIPPVFAVYPTVQTNAILLYYNALTFVCYIPLLVALIVFYRFTALAFVDVQQLSREHLIKDNNGALWIRKARQKTSQMCNIPVLSIPQRILRKYEDNIECIKKGVLLPVISNQRMNAYLKEIADLCGITKRLTTHVACHTAATVVFLANDVSMENVSKILGHSNIRMTQHYARVLDSSIMRDMVNVERNFLKE